MPLPPDRHPHWQWSGSQSLSCFPRTLRKLRRRDALTPPVAPQAACSGHFSGSCSTPRIATSLARISHQAACQCQKALGFHGVDHDVDDRTDCGLRWPRPRGSFGPVRARAPSTVVPATLSVASTRTGPKSSAIISTPGEKCGLACLAVVRCQRREHFWRRHGQLP